MYGPGTSYLDYGSDEDDGPVPAHYLMEDAVPDYRLTRSEQDLNNLMFSQSEGDAAMERFMITPTAEINMFVKWLKRSLPELKSKGYNSYKQMFAIYDSYQDHRAENKKFEIPHVSLYAHPEVEVQKYPVKGEPITREFIAYINNAMLADSDVQSQYVAEMLTEVTSDDDEFRKFLEYIAFYNLWHVSWGILYGVWMEVQLANYDDPKFDKFGDQHKPPVPGIKYEQTGLSKEQKRVQESRLYSAAQDNKQEALQYLRERRHWEHDKITNKMYGEGETFGKAPPEGMEHISRSQIFLDTADDERRGEIEETLIFPYEKEDDYDSYPLLGNVAEGRTVLPKLEDLYLESLKDPEVAKYNARRAERQLRLPQSTPYGPMQHDKQGEQFLNLNPHGREEGGYLVRIRNPVYGPYQPGEVPAANSDDSLAAISRLSLANLPAETEQETEMQKRRALLKYDEQLKFNRKLRSIFEDVIDHIGPNIAAPPTAYEFIFATQFFTSNKLEAEKWMSAHEKDAEENERVDLFRYYREARSTVANAVRDISIHSSMEMEELKVFRDKINKSDENMVKALFDDVLKPSCLKYMNTLTKHIDSLDKYSEALKNLEVYKSLMFYKSTENKTLFQDDVVWDEIQTIQKTNAKAREELSKAKSDIERASMTRDRLKASTTRVIETMPKYEANIVALKEFAVNIKNSLTEEEETRARLQAEVVKYQTEYGQNNRKLLAAGKATHTPDQSLEPQIRQLKEDLETNNAALNEQINRVAMETKTYSTGIAKKKEFIAKTEVSLKELDVSTKQLKSQKVAKEVFWLQSNNEKDDAKNAVVEKLTEAARKKTSAVIKHFKGLLDELNCTGTPKWISENDETYERITNLYHEKLITLGAKLEAFKSSNQAKKTISEIVCSAVQELDKYDKQIDSERSLYAQKRADCADLCDKLKKAKISCGELQKMYNEAGIQIKERERFTVFAKNAIQSASTSTEEPTDAALHILLKNIRETSAKNEEKKSRIAALQRLSSQRA